MRRRAVCGPRIPFRRPRAIVATMPPHLIRLNAHRLVSGLGLSVAALTVVACGGPEMTTNWEAPHLTGPATAYVTAVVAGDGTHTRYEAALPDGAEPRVRSTLPDLPDGATLSTVSYRDWIATQMGWKDDAERAMLAAYTCTVTLGFGDGSSGEGTLFLCRADLGPHDDAVQHEWRVIGVAAE